MMVKIDDLSSKQKTESVKGDESENDGKINGFLRRAFTVFTLLALIDWNCKLRVDNKTQNVIFASSLQDDANRVT